MMAPEHAANNEPTIIPPDREDNPETDTQEVDPDTSLENQPPTKKKAHPKSTPTQNLVPPEKENTTYAATDHQTGKRITRIIIHWMLT